VAQANVKLTVDATQATRALQGVQNKTTKLNGGINRLKTAIAGVGLTVLARQAVNTSANFAKLNVRLGLLTKASGTFARSQEIAAEAQKSFGLSATEALEGITDITARLQPLGVGVEDIRTTFIGFNTAAKLAGASAMESSNAFRQLAQALGSGRLQGDEFRSIAEQVPTLLAPIAKELNTTVGGLKKFASEGKLTSDVVIRALKKVEVDGAASLKALLENDPTQVFKDLGNEAENLSRAFGDLLAPAVLPVIKGITELTIAATDLVNSPIGKTAAIFTAIALAAKGVAIIIPVVTAGLISLAAAGGLATVALNAIPFVAIATAIGGVTTAIIKQREEQKKFNDVVNEGSEEEINKLLKKQEEIRKSLVKRLNNANGRKKESVQRTLDEVNADIALLEGRNNILEKEKEITKEKEKQNEASKKIQEEQKKQEEQTKTLKEKYMEIGKSIESGVVQNLTDAAMGTQTLGQAAISVLNDLKRKLIEVAIQQAVTGLGDFLGGALTRIFTRGQSASNGIRKIDPTQFDHRGRKANGGPVSAGGAYLVGERGPEILQMGSKGGNVIPNNAIGGGVTNMVTVNVDASGTSVQGDGSSADQLGQLIGGIVQSTLIQESRAGGLLNR